MPVMQLIPTEYCNSRTITNSSASVSNPTNALTDVNSSTSAVVSGTTSKYAVFLIPFWSQIPSGVTINNLRFIIKVAAQIPYSSIYIGIGKTIETVSWMTQTNYKEVITLDAQLFNNTNQHVITYDGFYDENEWETNFRDNSNPDNIYIGLRVESSTKKYNIFGMELLVDYEEPEPAIVTSTLIGNGSIEPHGQFEILTTENYSLTITPNNKYAVVNAEKDGVDITNDLVPHNNPYTLKSLPGEYEKESGSWANAGTGRVSATEWFTGIQGKGFDTTQSATLCYGSTSGTVRFAYPCPIENVPENAVLTRIYLKVNGRCAALNKTGMAVRVKYGEIGSTWIGMSTLISEPFNFSLQPDGTNDHVYTIECPTLPSKEKLANLFVECEVGTKANGAVINGFTLFAEFDYGNFVDHYTYTYEVTGDAQINVVITENPDRPKTMVKVKDEWVEIEKGYWKTADGWLERELNKILVPDGKYLKGN